MKILGTKFYGHDSAICLLDTEKKEIFAISTERVTRIKHDSADVSYIFNEYKELITNIDHVSYSFCDYGQMGTYFCDLSTRNILGLKITRIYRKLFKPRYLKDMNLSKKIKFKMLLKAFLKNPIDVFKIGLFYISMTLSKYYYSESNNLKSVKTFIKNTLKDFRINKNIDFFDHHTCHAYASYYFSNFVSENNNSSKIEAGGKTIILTIDGAGDGFFSKIFLAEGDSISEIGSSKTIDFKYLGNKYTTSVGFLYSRFTEAMDLTPGSDEGKVEALAAFGEKDKDLYEKLMEAVYFKNNGIMFHIDKIKYFYDIENLKKIRQQIGDKNFCATIQTWLEDVMVDYLNEIGKLYPDISNICLSGGVAANIIMSLNIYERTQFKNIYVLPFMADDGTAVGAAILKALQIGEDIKWLSKCYMPYFGNKIEEVDILKALNITFKGKVKYQKVGDGWQEMAANAVVNDKIIAIVQGRMEFGPRALGNRSILANPMKKETKDRINSTVKRRPWYQPFCPSILEEERERLFESSFSHKHMAIAFRMKREYWEILPSAIHIDGTARPQFVEEKDNPNYYRILKEIQRITGFGVVINTSFNLHGRTIVRTAEDAIQDFLDCNIDELYLEGYKIERL